MRTVTLGATKLEVTPLAYGTWQFGGDWGAVDERAARAEIAACKILASQVLKSIALRAIQVHGALGLTDQLPLVNVLLGGIALGLADGPTEAHKVNLARMLLKGYEAEDGDWPSEMLDVRRDAAREKYGSLVGRVPALPDSP